MYEVKIFWSDGNTYCACKDLAHKLPGIRDVLDFIAHEQELVGKHPDYPASVKIVSIDVNEYHEVGPTRATGRSQAMAMGQRQIEQAKMRGEWRGNDY